MSKTKISTTLIFFTLLLFFCACGKASTPPEQLASINVQPEVNAPADQPVETSSQPNVVIIDPVDEREEAAIVMADEPNPDSELDDEAAEASDSIQQISLDPSWQYASFSKINSGNAVLYRAVGDGRRGIVVGVNAGHGTQGGTSAKTYCHPDMTPKLTGGTTAQGALEAVAVSGGMSFNNGELEPHVTLRLARMLRDCLLERGYDVLMIRDGDDVQLDNVARTVICNNEADCHVSIHFDGDGLDYDKGCFYISVPDGLKIMEPVDRTWESSERLGDAIIKALADSGLKIHNNGSMDIDLTQTSYSTVPSVDVEYGNQCTDTSDEQLGRYAEATASGIDAYFTR